MKKTITLSEKKLHSIISEAINKVLSEDYGYISPEKYSKMGMTVANGANPLDDLNKKYFNNMLGHTNHLFRDASEQLKTINSYISYEQRRGSKPSLDGLLAFIGASRNDLAQYDRNYSN